MGWRFNRRLGDGTLTYSPAAGFVGDDSFSYTVSDGTDSASATVTVAVSAANAPPLAQDDAASTAQDTPLVLGVADLLANLEGIDWRMPRRTWRPQAAG